MSAMGLVIKTSVITFVIVFFVIKVAWNLFTGTKTCSRCDGKGWWQNTRNRETCEWCKGTGKLPKDFPD